LFWYEPGINRDAEMVWKLLSTVGKAVVEAAKLVLPRHMGHIADVVIAVVNGDGALVEQQEDIQLAQLKLQYLQHQENLEFQAVLAHLNDERTKELQAFIQRAEDARLHKNRGLLQPRDKSLS
jgi:hypothetical protein